jgi:hypothetical protein
VLVPLVLVPLVPLVLVPLVLQLSPPPPPLVLPGSTLQ